MDCSPLGPSVHEDPPGKNTGVGSHALLQEIFPTQRSNPGLLHCRQILSCLSHQGSPRILKWVVMPSSRGSSRPRDQTCLSYVSCIGRQGSGDSGKQTRVLTGPLLFISQLFYLVSVCLCVSVIVAFQLTAFTFRENLAATALLLVLFGYVMRRVAAELQLVF